MTRNDDASDIEFMLQEENDDFETHEFDASDIQFLLQEEIDDFESVVECRKGSVIDKLVSIGQQLSTAPSDSVRLALVEQLLDCDVTPSAIGMKE